MSVSTTALSDSLPSTVPKLDPTGINWAVFSIRFQDAIEAKGFWGHFDGTDPRPTPSSPPTANETTAEVQWLKDERSAKSLLTQKIPDGTLMRIHSKTSSDGTSRQVPGVPLRKVGVVIDDKDYLSTIIGSLPISLSSFASSQLASARMYAPTKTIDPDVLIPLLTEEADRLKSLKARRPGTSKSKDDEKDEALSTEHEVSKGSGKGGRSGGGGKKNITCWGCGEKGHFRNKCPKGSKPSKTPKKDSSSKGSANAAESDSEGDGVWALWDDDTPGSLLGQFPEMSRLSVGKLRLKHLPHHRLSKSKFTTQAAPNIFPHIMPNLQISSLFPHAPSEQMGPNTPS